MASGGRASTLADSSLWDWEIFCAGTESGGGRGGEAEEVELVGIELELELDIVFPLVGVDDLFLCRGRRVGCCLSAYTVACLRVCN